MANLKTPRKKSPKLYKKVSRKAGLSPGTLLYIGDEEAERIRIEVMDYSQEHLVEKQCGQVAEAFPFKESPTITWLNVVGVHNPGIIEAIGSHFDLHALTLEDILNTNQRPKFEDYEGYLFLVLKMVYYKETDLTSEQVSLIVGPNYVISFQEREGDVFEAVRARIRSGKGRIRKHGSDYLAYAIIDAIVDHYFVVLEKTGERIEEIEEAVTDNPTADTLSIVHKLKRELIYLRKSVWPLREVISSLQRGESPLMTKGVGVFLRDLYDHTVQIIDTIETFRDMVSGLLDVYLSSVSNRMNEVMKVLTLIATIFIPLTFIAGIYGMNFEYMPELHWEWAYPVVWTAMLAIGILMIIYFKRRKWL